MRATKRFGLTWAGVEPENVTCDSASDSQVCAATVRDVLGQVITYCSTKLHIGNYIQNTSI